MSRDELIVLVGEQAERIAAQDRQITALATRIADMDEAYEALAAKLARVEHLLSRNSGNSSSPPSMDDQPGKPAPQARSSRRGGAPKRKPGKQSGAPGFRLAWTDSPDERTETFPEGQCECGHDLAAATDFGSGRPLPEALGGQAHRRLDAWRWAASLSLSSRALGSPWSRGCHPTGERAATAFTTHPGPTPP
jgi:Family of unknown function (DUF6444)